jgi:hypothetical protein
MNQFISSNPDNLRLGDRVEQKRERKRERGRRL